MCNYFIKEILYCSSFFGHVIDDYGWYEAQKAFLNAILVPGFVLQLFCNSLCV